MAKKKSAKYYEEELRELIEKRTGEKCEIWLNPQIRATAANIVMLDKMQSELMDEKQLVNIVSGSMSQPKNEVNPLLPYYDKMQRTLLLQYEALGLNYKTTPSKVKEDTKKGATSDNPMLNFYKGQ